MEKRIKFKNVIDFITKAMDTNCNIHLYFYTEGNNNISISKELNKNDFKYKDISWKKVNNKLSINLSSSGFIENISDYVIVVEDRKDILTWESFIEDVIDYTHRKLEIEFNSFFKDEDSKPTTINDLDSEDD